MKLILMRHAEAEAGSPDPDRQLTPYGRQTARIMADFALQIAGFDIREVWTSPYRRALQTAEPFRAMLEKKVPFKTKEWLVPEGTPTKLLKEVRDLTETVLVIGHNPLLAASVGELIGQGCEELPGFRKGALFIFERKEHYRAGFRLEGYIPPSTIGHRK